MKVAGVFRGALLESLRFDFVNEDGHKLSGKIDDNLTTEQVSALSREFLDQQCIASVVKTTVLFKNGRVRTTFVLNGLEAKG